MAGRGARRRSTCTAQGDEAKCGSDSVPLPLSGVAARGGSRGLGRRPDTVYGTHAHALGPLSALTHSSRRLWHWLKARIVHRHVRATFAVAARVQPPLQV